MKSGGIRKLVVAAAGAALVAGPLLGTLPSARAVPAVAAPSCDWPTFGHDLGRSFASPAGCNTISDLTAPTLHPKWHVDTGSPVTAQPAVVGGTVYVGSAGGVFYAVDATSGTVKWTFNVTDQSQNDYGKITSSAAVADVQGSRVVVFGGGATLYVLDAATGQLLASQCVDPDPVRNCGSGSQTVEIESSPAVVAKGRGPATIVVGMDFNEDRNVGRAGVLNFTLSHNANGWQLTPVWKYDPETHLTYTSDPLHAGGLGDGCGNVWSSPMVDAATNLVVFGIGNCDVPAAGVTESVNGIALDTGVLRWSYEPRPDPNQADSLDLDFGATPNLLPSGRVGEGGKDGVYYSFGEDGTLNFAAPVATGSDIGGMIGSTALGKANGKAAVFASSAFPFHTGQPDVSLQENLQNPGHATGLHAIDAATGQKLWDAPAAPAYGAAVYSGGVVFLPDTFSFSMQAYDANTGVPVWVFPLGQAPASPPAVTGNSIYFGSGVSEAGLPVLGSIGSIWGFQTAL